MAITLKDVKAAEAKLPHPREWKASRMELIHRCEDGEDRRMTFAFKFENARTAEEMREEFEALIAEDDE